MLGDELFTGDYKQSFSSKMLAIRIGELEIGEFHLTVRSSREEFEPKKALERESREIDIQQMAGKCLWK